MTLRRSWSRRSLQRRTAATAAGATGAAAGVGAGEAAAFQVLDAIEAGGPLTVNGVADALAVDQPRASRLVARAVETGLVRRGADPDDGRRSVLAPTPRGARVLADGHRARRAAVEAALAGWPVEDRETFARLCGPTSAAGSGRSGDRHEGDAWRRVSPMRLVSLPTHRPCEDVEVLATDAALLGRVPGEGEAGGGVDGADAGPADRAGTGGVGPIGVAGASAGGPGRRRPRRSRPPSAGCRRRCS